ncbi:MAG: divergent PAP2 family protein [Spirochaetales bacterium]|nr:divergent PAP2 family protein [Spirochaetales bacterium]
MPLSLSLVIAVVIQLGCQAFKVVYYSIRDKRLRVHWFFSTGGMPSAHTAFVAALAAAVAMSRGLGSELFAVSFVFAAIVIYDILRVRAAVQAHSRILSMLLAERSAGRSSGPAPQAPPLPPEVGHSFPEVIAGLAVGIFGAVGLHVLLAPWAG